MLKCAILTRYKRFVRSYWQFLNQGYVIITYFHFGLIFEVFKTKIVKINNHGYKKIHNQNARTFGSSTNLRY